jgi:hypothetical protein
MTAAQLLKAMKEDGERPEGICIRGVWTYLIRGEPVTRAVNTLLRRKLVDGLYFSGGKAAINLSDAGRAA